MLLVGRQAGHPDCTKTEWWGAGVVICLEQGADLHMAQLMPLPLTVSCFSKIQIGFTFLVPAHLGSPGQRAVKCVCVCFYPQYHTLNSGSPHPIIFVSTLFEAYNTQQPEHSKYCSSNYHSLPQKISKYHLTEKNQEIKKNQEIN